MKNILQLGYVLFLLVAQTIIAQPIENSLLWKVSGNGLTKDSYLFGTLHATCDATLPTKVTTAFEQTEQLALEIDISDASIQQKMAMGMMIPDGKKIQDYLSDEEFKRLASNVEGKLMGMNLQMLQNIKPMFINFMLIPSVLECPQQAYDMVLMQLAQTQQMPIFGLENVEDQMNLFDAIAIEVQAKELLEATDNGLEKAKNEMEKLLRMYDDEDLLAMHDYLINDDTSFSANSDLFLDKRNESWIPVIEKMMKEKPSFFGFGAMHLIGEKGVIQLLKNQGYAVEAVY